MSEPVDVGPPLKLILLGEVAWLLLPWRQVCLIALSEVEYARFEKGESFPLDSNGE
jgi:hypothetical protein